jgi:hypothetical protein
MFLSALHISCDKSEVTYSIKILDEVHVLLEFHETISL